MANIVRLKLSGSEKLYDYLWDGNTEGALYVLPGHRAVVPSKLRDDGTLSLAIGTVIESLTNVELDPAIQYKHVVQFLSAYAISVAEQRMKALEQPHG